MRIVLIGFMATGKSTVAPALAAALGWRAIEMDDLVVQKAGRSIPEIFARGGEAAFRELETAVAKDLRDVDEAVISTGGGVVLSKPILDYLGENSVIVELSAPFPTLLRRITPKTSRPLFANPAEAKQLYEQRQPLYRQWADVRVSTDKRSVDEVVRAITATIELP